MHVLLRVVSPELHGFWSVARRRNGFLRIKAGEVGLFCLFVFFSEGSDKKSRSRSLDASFS